MQKLHVAGIDPDNQTFLASAPDSLLDYDEWHAAKLAVKVSPSVASTEELAEMGQYVLGIEDARMGATQ